MPNSGSERSRLFLFSVWVGPLLVGDPDHLKVFANAEAAEAWFAENDPEGVASEYEVLE